MNWITSCIGDYVIETYRKSRWEFPKQAHKQPFTELLSSLQMSPIKRKFGKFLFFLRTPDLFLSSAPIQTGDLPKRVSYPLTELHRNILKMAWCIPQRRRWENLGVKEHYWAKCLWQSLFLISAPFSQQFRKIRFVRFPIHIWELAWHVMRSRFVTRIEEWSENILPFNFILNLWGEIETARGDFIFRVSLCHGMEL